MSYTTLLTPVTSLTIRLDSTDTYNNLGIALTGKGNLEDAIQALNKALFLKSDFCQNCQIERLAPLLGSQAPN